MSKYKSINSDFVQIVRCRDCKYYKEKVYKWVNNWTRTERTCEVFDGCHIEPDSFCAWGEKG